MSWTLKYTPPPGGGEAIEKTFRQWLLSKLTRSDRSQRQGEVTFSIAGSATAALPFVHKGRITIYRDRADDFSGGTPWFTGVVLNPRRSGSGTDQRIQYTIADPWWYFTRIVFQQTYRIVTSFVGGDITQPVYGTSSPTTHVILNHDQNGEVCGSRAALVQILDWAISKGAVLQYNAADLPDMKILPRSDKDIFCETGIQYELSLMDAYTWFDHSFEPPMFKCKRRSDLTPAAINKSQRGVRTTDFEPRYDLQVPYVRILFEKSVNGFLAEPGEDHYPDPLPNDSIGALISTITLAPYVSNVLNQPLTVEAINAGSVDWWKGQRKELADAEQYSGLTIIPNSSFKRDVGSGAASLLPNKIVSGGIASWMNKTVATVEVGAKFSYRRKKTTTGSNSLEHTEVSEHLVKVRLRATNAVSGNYRTEIIQTLGESVGDFAGIAQQIYDDLSVLNYEGSASIIEDRYTGNIGMGNVLNILNGAEEWETMNAGIQAVTQEMLDNGGMITTFEVGPNKHLSPDQLADILRWNRTQTLYGAVIGRANASLSGGAGAVDLPDGTAQENTTDGPPLYNELIIGSQIDAAQNTWLLKNSAKAGTGGVPQISIQKVDPSGAAVADTQSLIFNMADLVPSPGQPPLQMKFQKIKDTGGHDHYVAATTPDIGTGSGGGGCEPYDSTKIYSAKSMVLVQTGTNAGMWCVAPGKTAAAGQAPVFPVPADPTWLLLALGVQFTSVCANGTKTVAVNMSSPF